MISLWLPLCTTLTITQFMFTNNIVMVTVVYHAYHYSLYGYQYYRYGYRYVLSLPLLTLWLPILSLWLP